MTLRHPTVRILRKSDARIRPWKNGRGQTAEILVLPDGADFLRGDFDVRISRAAVIEDGPFSNFAGFDRIIVVVAGEGILLDHGDGSGEKLLPKHTPHHFSGDATTTGRLIHGPIEDFNVIVRRGRVRAQIEIVDAVSQLIEGPADRFVVHVFSGEFSFRTSSGDSGRLFSGDSLDVERPPASSAVQLSANDPAARAAIVRISSDRPGDVTT